MEDILEGSRRRAEAQELADDMECVEDQMFMVYVDKQESKPESQPEIKDITTVTAARDNIVPTLE